MRRSLRSSVSARRIRQPKTYSIGLRGQAFYDVPKLNVSMRPYPGVVMGLIDLPNQELAHSSGATGNPRKRRSFQNIFVGER